MRAVHEMPGARREVFQQKNDRRGTFREPPNMTTILILSIAGLMYASYQIGRIVGRGERTVVDVEWEERTRLGYVSRS